MTERSDRQQGGAECPDGIYLDHSATTPLAPEVLEAMLPYLRECFGNPSAGYALGRAARCALEEARMSAARSIGCAPGEVIFTSGGSESDNLALRGVAHACRAAGHGAHLVTTAVEHEAVLATVHALTQEGFEATVVDVDAHGRVGVGDVLAALRHDTVLVSVMLANNEVGTLQPVAELGAALAGSEHGAWLHSDAVQVPAWQGIDVQSMGIDLLSLSAHKLYGPKGVGLLYVRDGTPLRCTQTGGGQERHVRAGTENVAGAVGMATALERAERGRDQAVERVRALSARLIECATAIEGVRLTGHPTERMPHHVSLCVEGVPADVLLLGLDMRGVFASSGSACSTGKLEASHVLRAMGIPDQVATGAVRFSLGWGTTAEEIEHVVEVLGRLVERMRLCQPAA